MDRGWHGVRRRWRAGVAKACLPVLLLAAGCRTSADAKAAAAQITVTAKTLTDFYGALGTMLRDREATAELNDAVYAKPFPAESRAGLEKTRAALAQRVVMAADLTQVADAFGKLAGSSAAADASAAALRLQTDAAALAGVTPSDEAVTALRKAVQVLVTAVQERKERQAARALQPVVQGLTGLFAREAPVWNSEERVYTALAANLAEGLVNDRAIDGGSLLRPALEPFGLQAGPLAAPMQAQLAPLSKRQIEDRHAALDRQYAAASEAMQGSLMEMSNRVGAVAEKQPMHFRLPPPTLATVEQWVQTVTAK